MLISKGESLFSRGIGVLLSQQEPHPMGSTRDTDSALPVLPLSGQKPQCPKLDPAGAERAVVEQRQDCEEHRTESSQAGRRYEPELAVSGGVH